MQIKNTNVEAAMPWPGDILVQGGDSGLVVTANQDRESYFTAFCEALPDHTFLRGEGSTVEIAEQACWEKYLLYLRCSDGSGSHGPFEARNLGNGTGFCTKCGIWFDADVANCQEDEKHRQHRIDFNDLTIEVLTENKWPPNQFQAEVVRRMKHRTAIREALEKGEDPPVLETVEPVEPEEFDRNVSGEIANLLDRMAGKHHVNVDSPESE